MIEEPRKSMIEVVYDYLKQGNEISARDAATLWGELNLRNKIVALRKRGVTILAREEINPRTKSRYKVYYMPMDGAA